MLVSIYLVKLTWYIFTFSIGEWFVIKKGQPNYYTEVQLEFLIKISFNMQRLLDSGNSEFIFQRMLFHFHDLYVPFKSICPLLPFENNRRN